MGGSDLLCSEESHSTYLCDQSLASPFPPRCEEESHLFILARNQGRCPSRSMSSLYECKYCHKRFTGGPKKIRVHFIGTSQNGTRVSACTEVSIDVKVRMQELEDASHTRGKRVAYPKGAITEVPMDETPLSPRNAEEAHMIVLSRVGSNARYRCLYCKTELSGGPQKIRVHLAGAPEGVTRVVKCPKVPSDLQEQMRSLQLVTKRKAYRKRLYRELSVSEDCSTSTDPMSPVLLLPLAATEENYLLDPLDLFVR
eukprot:gene30046-36289_t